MEVSDLTTIPEYTAKAAFAKSSPCTICNSKDDLALGVIASGQATGRLLVFCFRCQYEPVDERPKD